MSHNSILYHGLILKGVIGVRKKNINPIDPEKPESHDRKHNIHGKTSIRNRRVSRRPAYADSDSGHKSEQLVKEEVLHAFRV